MTFATHQQQRAAAAPVPPPPSPALHPGDRGPDVASHQHPPGSPHIDWRAVAASGARFAWVKSTEGVDYFNPFFPEDWRGIAEAGLVRGAYHYALPSQNSPQAEADYFLRNAVPLDQGDMLALDIEDPAAVGDLYGWVQTFLRLVAQGALRLAWTYSGTPYLKAHNLTHAELAQESAGLWLAAYQQTVPPPPPGWLAINMWQHTDAAVVPGIPGGVDMSVYLGE